MLSIIVKRNNWPGENYVKAHVTLMTQVSKTKHTLCEWLMRNYLFFLNSIPFHVVVCTNYILLFVCSQTIIAKQHVDKDYVLDNPSRFIELPAHEFSAVEIICLSLKVKSPFDTEFRSLNAAGGNLWNQNIIL